MNRKLLSIAVAGVFAAPAMALAQSSTVQLYGRIIVEYGYADPGNGRPNTDQVAGLIGGSAVGVRGEEKLGGGLSAWFQCESSADVLGVAQAGFCGRSSGVGFKHNSFGNIHIGRWETPLWRAMSTGGPTWIGAPETGLLGPAPLLTGGRQGTGTTGGQGASQSLQRGLWGRRDSSMIAYDSPIIGGFQVLASYTSANATAVTDGTLGAKPRVQSLAGIYTNGPVRLDVAYERHNSFGNKGGANDDQALTAGVGLKVFGDGAYFKALGNLRVSGQFINTRYELATNGSLQKTNWMVGGEWDIMGPHSIEANYTEAGKSKGTATAAQVAASGLNTPPQANSTIVTPLLPGTGAQMIYVGYRYGFSKRTNVKLGYVRLNNDDNARYSLGGLATPPTGGQNQDAVALLISHFF